MMFLKKKRLNSALSEENKEVNFGKTYKTWLGIFRFFLINKKCLAKPIHKMPQTWPPYSNVHAPPMTKNYGPHNWFLNMDP
jgi:hypothetical protein